MRTIIASGLALSAVSASLVAVNDTTAIFDNASDEIYAKFQAKLAAAEQAVDLIKGRSSTPSQQADLANAENELAGLRRFKQMKAMVLHQQPDVTFGRYCYYGCWCMAIGHEGFKGKGQPQDPVDSACKIHTQCYECAQMDENTRPGNQCNPETVKYSYNLLIDSVTNEREIVCNDPYADEAGGNKKSHCRRAICECDRGLAFRLAEQASYWIIDHHHLWEDPVTGAGLFDNVAECQPSGNGGNNPDTCCGKYDYPNTRFPYASNGGSRGCCGRKTYDAQLFECCSDDTVAPLGAC